MQRTARLVHGRKANNGRRPVSAAGTFRTARPRRCHPRASRRETAEPRSDAAAQPAGGTAAQLDALGCAGGPKTNLSAFDAAERAVLALTVEMTHSIKVSDATMV